MTFFTIAPEFKGKHYGRRLWSECVQLAKESGYDGVLHYCVDGNKSNGVTQAGCRDAGFLARHIFTVHYLMRFLSKPDYSSERKNHTVESRAVIEASRKIDVDLKRNWTERESRWQCVERFGAVCVEGAGTSSSAVISGYNINIADADGTPCTFVEDVLWHSLSPEGQVLLLQQFMTRCAEDSRIMIVPLLNYVDAAPFEKLRFRRSTRVLNTYLTLFQETYVPEISSMYIDVL